MADFDSDALSVAPGGDPLAVLNTWYEEAVRRGDPLPDAMTLATATLDGRPSARIVLFKGIKRGGVLFVTNYQSRKAREMEQNPRAALVMHFPTWERQVRIEGRGERAARRRERDDGASTGEADVGGRSVRVGYGLAC